jgi:hypothetical protein
MCAKSIEELSYKTQPILAIKQIRPLFLVYAVIVATNLATSLYASIGGRGLYADAAALLVVIYEGSWFPIFGSRAIVEALRQIPIILLSKYSSATLLECGQVLSFIMLGLPTILCAFCWFILPRTSKAWILFPLASLPVGFAATSINAVGEAAIATGYYWILLFLLLFRARSLGWQALFLLLCMPAFRLHEGAFPLTAVLILALVMRIHAAVGQRRERLFVGIAAVLLATIFAYQIYCVIHPRFPGDREIIVRGLTQFEFLYFDSHFNLPAVSGTLALLALLAVFVISARGPNGNAKRLAKNIAFAWALVALATIATAVTVEQSISPHSQFQARYHPVFVSAALATSMILLIRYSFAKQLWMQPTTIFILISLCATQAMADIAATRRWNDYVAELQSRLTRERGLIPWETAMNTSNERANINWRLFTMQWVAPYTCIIFAPNGIVTSMVDLPKSLTFRPLDPERPDRLPKLRGINFEPYKSFFADQKSKDSS